jgi:hypothetical protein
VLEGGRSAVNQLYNRIAADPRHTEVELLQLRRDRRTPLRRLVDGPGDMARLNPALLLKYSERATLDPYAVSGEVSMALFDELVATARPARPNRSSDPSSRVGNWVVAAL